MRPEGSHPPATQRSGTKAGSRWDLGLWGLPLLAILLGGTVQFGFTGSARHLAIMSGVAFFTFTATLAIGQRARRPGPESLGWRLLGLSLTISFLVQVTRVLNALGAPLPAHVSGASIGLPFLATCLQVGALLAWNRDPRSRFDRIRHGLDGLLFALAVFFILWGLVLGPVFLNDSIALMDRLVYLGTFAIFDLLLGLAVYLGLPDPTRFRGPLGWLACAFMLASLHNFFWLLDVLSGHAFGAFPKIPPFILFIPLAYLAAARSSRQVAGPSLASSLRPSFIYLLPYVPVLGAATLGLWQLIRGTGSGPRIVLVWLALGQVLIILIRQYLALRDYSTLSAHLESRVVERTEALERAQAMLLRTERLNAMATLGAGLAHDLNNLLCAIQGRVELCVQDLEEGRPAGRADLARALEAATVAATISNRLMGLGRLDPEPPKSMDLAVELPAIQSLLKVLLPRHQILKLDPIPESIPFLGTRGMLEQILVNLVSNARDAMPQGGTITVRTRPAGTGEQGTGPVLEIEDTGDGIPVELQPQVFQPFFTTKTAGNGTGLGLASVKLLLEKMGGSIWFSTQPGRGTTFHVQLPAE